MSSIAHTYIGIQSVEQACSLYVPLEALRGLHIVTIMERVKPIQTDSTAATTPHYPDPHPLHEVPTLNKVAVRSPTSLMGSLASLAL